MTLTLCDRCGGERHGIPIKTRKALIFFAKYESSDSFGLFVFYNGIVRK